MGLSRSRFSEWLAQPLLDTDLKEELLEMADSPQKIEDALAASCSSAPAACAAFSARARTA